MNYFLFKLRFQTAVHFGLFDSALSLYSSGDHFYADTLFSALCHMARDLWGETGVERLCGYVRDGKLRLSDSMPWCADRLYIPKPFVHAENRNDVPSQLRKQVKKLAWIEIAAFSQFVDALHGGEIFQPRQVKFGSHDEQTRVSLDSGFSTPYQVGTYQFCRDCGLYFIAGCENGEVESCLTKLMEVLGFSGIGAKTSSGLGRFECQKMPVEDSKDQQLRWLRSALDNENTPDQLLLTTSLPTDEELDRALEGASFQLIRRSGFANCRGDSFYKKQTQYFLTAGSLLRNRFDGALYQVGSSGSHPIFRYAVPIFLGVCL